MLIITKLAAFGSIDFPANFWQRDHGGFWNEFLDIAYQRKNSNLFAGFFLSKQRCILLVITQNSNQFSVPVFPAWVKVEHVQCLKSHTFSNSCAKNRHDLLAKIVGEVDGTKCG